MVTAIYAVGSEGQFGYNGGLPWGSFPQELEAYYSALEHAFGSKPGPRILLVGSSTWKSLPKKAVDKLLEYTTNVWVLSKNGYVSPRSGERLTIVTNIGYALPEEWEYHNVVCIGGGFLLRSLFAHAHITKAYVSTISWDKPMYYPETQSSFMADTWLRIPLTDTTKILMKTGYKLVPEQDNCLRFKQELHYI